MPPAKLGPRGVTAGRLFGFDKGDGATLEAKRSPVGDGASRGSVLSWGGQLEERRLPVELSDSDSDPRRPEAVEPVPPAAVLEPVEPEPADAP